MDEQLKHYSNKLAYEIDAWDLKVMLENKENVIVIDARSAQAFNGEHIPSAVSIPHRTMNGTYTAQLDKSALIVTYCDGIGCCAPWQSTLPCASMVSGMPWSCMPNNGHPGTGSMPCTC